MLAYSVTDQDAMLLMVPPAPGQIQVFRLKWPDGRDATETTLTEAVDQYLRTMLAAGYERQRSAIQQKLDGLKRTPAVTSTQRGETEELARTLERIRGGSLAITRAKVVLETHSSWGIVSSEPWCRRKPGRISAPRN